MKIMLPSLRQVAPLPFHQPNGFKLVTGLGQEVDRRGAATIGLSDAGSLRDLDVFFALRQRFNQREQSLLRQRLIRGQRRS
jgi:hypothetical protein